MRQLNQKQFYFNKIVATVAIRNEIKFSILGFEIEIYLRIAHLNCNTPLWSKSLNCVFFNLIQEQRTLTMLPNRQVVGAIF